MMTDTDDSQCATTPANSDDHMHAAVQTALACTGHFALRTIAVNVENGCVHLAGYVETYYAKQLAQIAALSVEGVEHVVNGIAIQ